MKVQCSLLLINLWNDLCQTTGWMRVWVSAWQWQTNCCITELMWWTHRQQHHFSTQLSSAKALLFVLKLCAFQPIKKKKDERKVNTFQKMWENSGPCLPMLWMIPEAPWPKTSHGLWLLFLLCLLLICMLRADASLISFFSASFWWFIFPSINRIVSLKSAVGKLMARNGS